jgi:hypothetical protein
MTSGAARRILPGMVNVGEMSACLGAEPIGRRDDPAHVDGRIFIAAGHGARQRVDDKPNAFFAGLFLCVADKGEQGV